MQDDFRALPPAPGLRTAATTRRNGSLWHLMRRAACSALWLGTAFGCSSTARAVRQFEQAHYPEALRELVALEAEYTSLETEDQARYALYRGLAHLTLGEGREAAAWLSRARDADWRAKSLSIEERGRLAAAWRTLGLMPGERIRIALATPR